MKRNLEEISRLDVAASARLPMSQRVLVDIQKLQNIKNQLSRYEGDDFQGCMTAAEVKQKHCNMVEYLADNFEMATHKEEVSPSLVMELVKREVTKKGITYNKLQLVDRYTVEAFRGTERSKYDLINDLDLGGMEKYFEEYFKEYSAAEKLAISVRKKIDFAAKNQILHIRKMNILSLIPTEDNPFKLAVSDIVNDKQVSEVNKRLMVLDGREAMLKLLGELDPSNLKNATGNLKWGSLTGNSIVYIPRGSPKFIETLQGEVVDMQPMEESLITSSGRVVLGVVEDRRYISMDNTDRLQDHIRPAINLIFLSQIQDEEKRKLVSVLASYEQAIYNKNTDVDQLSKLSVAELQEGIEYYQRALVEQKQELEQTKRHEVSMQN